MVHVETRPVIESRKFYQLEAKDVVAGFQAICERPNLIERAGTLEAKTLSARLQVKGNRGEPWTPKDFRQISDMVFTKIPVTELQKLYQTVQGYMVGNVSFLGPLKIGIFEYLADRERLEKGW